jgi:hypothetical protein
MSRYNAIRSDKHYKMCCQFRNHNMHTHAKDGKVQCAVTLTWATTEAEKKSKDASGGAATRRTRMDILVRQRCGWWEGLDETGTPHGAQNYHFEGLIEAPCTCDDNFCQWSNHCIVMSLRHAPTAIGCTV